ncbi:WD40 repeat-like protein [Ceratobasidium sp. AG-I]|nr:WD40 repeat-like protein [Ceratobasidium sp. AG-I]
MSGNDLSPRGVWTASNAIDAVALSSRGRRFVSGSKDSKIVIWDIDSETAMVGPLSGHTKQVNSVAFSPDSTRIISGSSDKTIIIWDAQSGKILAGPLEGHTEGVYSVAFSHDGARFVSGSSDHVLLIWDAHSGGILIGPIKGHSLCVYSVAFSPNDTHVVSGSEDRTLRVWDTRTGNSTGEPLEGHTEWVLSVAFSPDGRYIASGSVDCTVRIWDVQSGTEVLKPLEGHTSWVFSVAFSPNSACIVSASDDRTIRIWDTHTGNVLAEQSEAHTDTINTVAFSSDGDYVMSGSDDRTIRMWSTQQVSQLQRPAVAWDSMSDMVQSRSPSPDTPEKTIRATVEVSSRTMTARDMFDCLLAHGCTDLSLRMDSHGYSSIAVAGGAFGDIWRGKLSDGTEVAIKCLRFHAIAEDDIKGRKRAMREMYMWSKAKHENVHELLGAIMFRGYLGMVSPWMKHGNLQEYVRKNRDVDRYQLCVDVAAGMSYLHDTSMIHGDLKAGNILISQNGIAKISDFDHAILSNPTLVFSATANVGGGTMRWMAPELLLSSDDDGNPTANRTMQTDIYALGMTILEIISGNVPYVEYKNESGIYRALDKKKPPNRPKELLLPEERGEQMWSLLLQCWDHDPTARPEASVVLRLLQTIVTETHSHLP